MKSKILALQPQESHILLQLDNPLLRPSGGGQPADKGKIDNEEVIDIVKKDDKLFYKIKTTKEYKVGDTVEVSIDEQRRDKLTRMHTGEHILFKSLEKNIKDLKLEKINLEEDESSLFISAPGITLQNVLDSEKLANKIINENRPITIHKVKKEEFVHSTQCSPRDQNDKPLNSGSEADNAETRNVLCTLKQEHTRFPGLRIKIDRIKEESIDVIEIKDFDYSACTGTHLKKTGDVKNLLVTKFNSLGKNIFELHFKVDTADDLFKFADLARNIQCKVKTDFNLLEKTIENLMKENQELKDKFRELSKNIKVEIKEEKLNSINFIYASFPGINQKDFMEKLSKAKTPSSLVCFLNENQIAITVSEDLYLDASSILKKLIEQFKGKGGGRKNFASGSLESIDGIFEFVKEICIKSNVTFYT